MNSLRNKNEEELRTRAAADCFSVTFGVKQKSQLYELVDRYQILHEET